LGHLLIVDDEVQLTRIICEALTKYGYETVGVASPQEAVELLRRQDFDLLLTDLSMPKMDGIELLRAAAEIDPSIVGILMTGHGTVQTAVDAMKTGAHDYILKPFKLQDALNVVARAMESRRLMLENVQLREMLAIHELTIALARAHDLDVIVEKAVSAVVNQLDADEASILLPTSDQRELYVAAVRGADRSQILGERTPKTRGIAGWVALQRQAVLLEGEVDDERFAPVAPRAEIMSSMSAPMIEGGRLVGVINVNTLCAERSFDAEDVDLLSTFASESARSLAQFPDGVTGADLDSALQAIADDVIERLGTDEASVMLPTSDGKELYVAALGGNRPVRVLGARVSISAGIAGWVADHKTPVTLNGTVDDSRFAPMYPRPDIVSSISMPMMAGGRVVGIVNANVVNRRRPFAPGAVKALNVLAGAAASAIAEATLQQQLREAEERYRTIVENAVEGIFQSCPDGRFLTVNPSHARILGYDSPEDFLTNVTSSEQLHVDAGRRDQFWALLSEQGVARDFEARFRRKDGKVVWISVNARAIRDSDGGIVACEGTMQDITARMEAQEAQIESGKFLQATLDALPAHIAVLDENGIIITTNACCAAVGIREQTISTSVTRRKARTRKSAMRPPMRFVRSFAARAPAST
jgi:PAS domain S-box-containing protein